MPDYTYYVRLTLHSQFLSGGSTQLSYGFYLYSQANKFAQHMNTVAKAGAKLDVVIVNQHGMEVEQVKEAYA